MSHKTLTYSQDNHGSLLLHVLLFLVKHRMIPRLMCSYHQPTAGGGLVQRKLEPLASSGPKL